MSCPDGFVLDLFAFSILFWLACLFCSYWLSYFCLYGAGIRPLFLDGLGFDLCDVRVFNIERFIFF